MDDKKSQKKIGELGQMITNLSRMLAKSFNYASEDPDTFLQNARRTTEAMCMFIYKKEIGAEPKKKMMLNDLARELYNKKIIPERIGILIGTIQTYGNYGSHAQEDLTETTREWIAPCQTALANLTNWFFLEYIKGDIPTDLTMPVRDYADTHQEEPIKDLLKPEGTSRKKSQWITVVIVAVAVLVGLYFAYDLFFNNPEKEKRSADPSSTDTETLAAGTPAGAEDELAGMASETGPLPDATRIAILYFDSDDANIQNLRKGLADMLITDLSKFRSLNVVERSKLEEIIKEQDLSNTKRFDNATAATIGKLLGAECILVGSYFEMMGSLRIDARIVDVETGKVLKSEGVDGASKDFFKLEKDLAKKLVTQLDVSLDDENKKYLEPGDKGMITYDESILFSKGLEYYDKGEIEKAREIFEAVLKKYPGFEPAKNALQQINI